MITKKIYFFAFIELVGFILVFGPFILFGGNSSGALVLSILGAVLSFFVASWAGDYAEKNTVCDDESGGNNK